jgi:hypothetical protein
MFTSLASDDESMLSKLLIAQVIEYFAKMSDISVVNNSSDTPLSLFVGMKDDCNAIAVGNQTVNLLSIVDLLLGDEPTNILNPLSGRRPLVICAERGLSFLFGHLISKGADPSLKNESGEIPLDIIGRRIQELGSRLFLTSSDRKILNGLHGCYEVLMAKPPEIIPTEVTVESDPNTEYTPREIIFHRSGRRLEVRSGQIFALVRYLTRDLFSEVDARALVAGYPSVCDHEQFFMLLLSEFEANDRPGGSTFDVLRLLFVWIAHRQLDAGNSTPS